MGIAGALAGVGESPAGATKAGAAPGACCWDWLCDWNELLDELGEMRALRLPPNLPRSIILCSSGDLHANA